MTRRLTPYESDLIAAAISGLARTYTEEGVARWLSGAKRRLGGRTPLDLVAEGRADEFASAVEWLGDWRGRRPETAQARRSDGD